MKTECITSFQFRGETYDIQSCETGTMLEYLYWADLSYCEEAEAILDELCIRMKLHREDYKTRKDAYRAANRAYTTGTYVDYSLSMDQLRDRRELKFCDDDLRKVIDDVDAGRARTARYVYYDTHTGRMATEDIGGQDTVMVELHEGIKTTQDLIDFIAGKVNELKLMDELFWHRHTDGRG